MAEARLEPWVLADSALVLVNRGQASTALGVIEGALPQAREIADPQTVRPLLAVGALAACAAMNLEAGDLLLAEYEARSATGMDDEDAAWIRDGRRRSGRRRTCRAVPERMGAVVDLRACCACPWTRARRRGGGTARRGSAALRGGRRRLAGVGLCPVPGVRASRARRRVQATRRSSLRVRRSSRSSPRCLSMRLRIRRVSSRCRRQAARHPLPARAARRPRMRRRGERPARTLRSPIARTRSSPRAGRRSRRR